VLNARLVRRFFAVAALLALTVPVTMGIEAWRVHRLRADLDARAEAATAETREAVQERTTALLTAMLADAERLATDPLVQQALADSLAPAPTRDEALLRRFEAVGSAPRMAAEAYRSDGALVAWGGFSAPFGPAARRGLPDTLRTGIVLDGTERRIVVAWWPVRAGSRQVGAVRVMREVQVSVPVRNRYLQDYDLADGWRVDLDLPFSVAFTGRRRAFAGDAAPLWGPGGSRLGWVQVPTPSEAFLVGRLRGAFRDVTAFWLVLLAGWLLAGLWLVVERSMQRALRRGTAGAWWAAGAVFTAWALGWWATRFGFLTTDVPTRWIRRGGFASALFDPTYLASDVGGGLLRSAGDLVITAGFAGFFAVALLRFALLRSASAMTRRPEPVRPLRSALLLLGTAVLSAVVVAALTVGVRRAVLDATLGYFNRSGPVPEPLTLLVLAALLAAGFAATGCVAALIMLVRVALGRRQRSGPRVWAAALGLLAAAFVATYVVTPLSDVPPWSAALLYLAAAGAGAYFLLGRRDRWAWPLTFRGMLVCVLVLVPCTYLLMLRAARERRDALMVEAAEDFAGGQDRRAVFAIEQVLAGARSDELRPALLAAVEADRLGRAVALDTAAIGEPTAQDSLQATLDGLVSDLVSGSLLAALSDYTVELALLTPEGDTLAAYTDTLPADERGPRNPRARKDDPLAFERLRQRYEARTGAGFTVNRAPIERRRGVYRYAGLGPVEADDDDAPPAVWVYARATPRLQRYVTETPFPLVLVPAGLFGEVDEGFSYAEYDAGVFVRGRGETGGPFRLPPEVRERLARTADAVWVREVVEGARYRTYYRRLPAEKGERLDAVAVRVPAVAYYDHLFYLLRMTVAGLLLGSVIYLAGVPVRRRAGLLPAPKSRFRDKVLTRFLIVGIASVGLTGVIGRQVVVEQNRQSVRDLLQRRLHLAEAQVTAEAGPGVPVAASIERARADHAAAQLAVDVHVFLGPRLVSTSRPQLVRQRLIDGRLPAEVYRALMVEGRRYAFTRERIGSFTYTTGYKAIGDEHGRTVGVVAVPTLPEQAAIEAEQARMIAYLFGALLALLIGIFVTTALLASQLTRPFRSLRAGLQAVGAGRMEEPLPVESRDEMGELVETFNRMQAQVVESRRQLAQQERELAWREMARQVAHEIKNPLTPMKLSVQHLRRAYRAPGDGATAEERRFAGLLDRITTTLIEQIDALDRIAGEFSTFARLPKRNPERLDLGEVVREAGVLFEDEARAEGPLTVDVRLDLADAPLPVEADHEELRRAFINLFKNALQALPDDAEGGRPRRITARTWRGVDGHAYAEVEDTGTGIPPAVRPRIFQPNFSTKNSGMGLGLAIVQKAVEASGGHIDFETEEGVGTTFTLRFPLADEG